MPNTVKIKLTRETILTGKLIPEVLTTQNFLSGFHCANLDHAGLECLRRDVNLPSPGQKDTTLCLNRHGRSTKTLV